MIPLTPSAANRIIQYLEFIKAGKRSPKAIKILIPPTSLTEYGWSSSTQSIRHPLFRIRVSLSRVIILNAGKSIMTAKRICKFHKKIFITLNKYGYKIMDIIRLNS